MSELCVYQTLGRETLVGEPGAGERHGIEQQQWPVGVWS